MDEKSVVVSFLTRCNEYAQASIERKIARGEEAAISDWQSYIDFNQHAIDEIHSGKLDDWFKPMPYDSTQPRQRVDLSCAHHDERSLWLNQILTPRPVAIIASTSSEGNLNFAPYSSVMHVSTHPPYITASFSVHQDGRHRDTFENLKATGKAVLNFLPIGASYATLVDDVAYPYPHGVNEATQTVISTLTDHPLVLEHSIAAIEVEYVDAYQLPDAVAVMAVMKATTIISPFTRPPSHGLPVLCQHGRDVMMGAPSGWSQPVDKHYAHR